MSTALYRRYRPDSFEHVIGQDHVTVPLRAALDANKVTHAYLFSGPRGCGKTTSARILARCLNCAQGPTASPCGTCDSCRELATGGPGSLDVVEIDAASHGGVDDARELRERATFAPVRDRYKVFIIDEAHMVTQAGFNALLKLVEEPPEHVKFVFATTEPDKVLGTIRSRTHHYPFRLVPPDVLEPYLAHLAQGEGVDIAPGVLNLVIRAGGGSVRDTLSVLDQLMAGAVNGHLPYSQAVALLGYTDVALLDESVDALAGGDGAAVYRVVERMVDSGHDPRRFVEDLLQRLRDLLIIAVAGDGAVDVLSGVPADQLERMMTQARNWGPRALSHAADLTDKALRSMVGATSPRLQLELLIGRILVPVSSAPAAEAVQGIVGLVGGGAPHERSEAEGGSARSAGGAPFGAAQAKERLQAMRSQGGDAASAVKPEMPQNVASQPPVRQKPAGHEQAVRPETSAQQSIASEPQTSAGPQHVAAAWDAVVPTPPQVTEQRSSSGQQLSHHPEVTPVSSPESTPAPDLGSNPESAPVRGAENAPGQVTIPRSGASSDADMLRQRWPEVIERLSSISRVAWALLNGNGQLGGVDGQHAVVVLPTQGMVDAFVNGQRGPAIEQAIYEATGLKLAVVAQVGQAQGGASVTTPTASAAREQAHPSHEAPSSPGPYHVQQQRIPEGEVGVVGQQAPFRAEQSEVASDALAASKQQYSIAQTENVGQTQRSEWAAPLPSEAMPVQHHNSENSTDTVQQPSKTMTSGLEPNTMTTSVNRLTPESAHLAPSQSDTFPAQADVQESPYSAGEVSALGQVGVFNDQYDDSEATEETSNSSVPEAVSWPAPATVPASAPSVEDFPIHAQPVTWEGSATQQSVDEPVSVEHRTMQPQAGIWESYGQGDVTWGDAHTPAANVTFAEDKPEPASPSHKPYLEVISNNAPGNASVEEEHVNAADDDSASIDDDDIEVDMTVGLDAVREILGATVIDERVEESSW